MKLIDYLAVASFIFGLLFVPLTPASGASISLSQEFSNLNRGLESWSRQSVYYEGPFDQISTVYFYGNRTNWFDREDISFRVGGRFYPDANFGFFAEVGVSPTHEIAPQTAGALGVRYTHPDKGYTVRLRGDYSRYADGESPGELHFRYEQSFKSLQYEFYYNPSWTDEGTFGDQQGIELTWLSWAPHYLQFEFQGGDNITNTDLGPVRSDYNKKVLKGGYYIGNNWTLVGQFGAEEVGNLYERDFGSLSLQWSISAIELGARLDDR